MQIVILDQGGWGKSFAMENIRTIDEMWQGL